MRITNVTKWLTYDLRSLAVEVASRDVLLSENGRKNLRVVFHYQSTSASPGTWNIPGTAFVKLPRDGEISSVDVAKNLAWAIGAAIGISRRDMKGIPRYQFDGSYWEKIWQVRDAIIREKPVKENPSKPPKTTRAEWLQFQIDLSKEKTEFWHRKTQQACNKIATWIKVRNKYERLLAEEKAKNPETVSVPSPAVETTTGRKFRRTV